MFWLKGCPSLEFIAKWEKSSMKYVNIIILHKNLIILKNGIRKLGLN